MGWRQELTKSKKEGTPGAGKGIKATPFVGSNCYGPEGLVVELQLDV